MKGEGGQAQGEVKEMVLHATGGQRVESLAKEGYCCKQFRGVQEKNRYLIERCTEEEKDVKK